MRMWFDTTSGNKKASCIRKVLKYLEIWNKSRRFAVVKLKNKEERTFVPRY